MNTWRNMITDAMGSDDSFDNVVGEVAGSFRGEDYQFDKPPAVSWLDEEFEDGFGWPAGCHFTLWTKDYVYFPVCYDGAESVGRAPRNPTLQPNAHVGGW